MFIGKMRQREEEVIEKLASMCELDPEIPIGKQREAAEKYVKACEFMNLLRKAQWEDFNETYSDNIPEFISALKEAIKEFVCFQRENDEFFKFLKRKHFKNESEALRHNVYGNFIGYFDAVGEKAPDRVDEIVDFIEKVIEIKKGNSEEMNAIEKNVNEAIKKGFEIIKIAPENSLTQAMFSGKSISALGRARTNGIFEPFEGKLVVDGVNIFSPESVQKIGVGTAKIYRYAVAEFTKHNEKNATGNKIKQRLLLDVKDFATANGVDINSTDAMKNFRRKLKNSLNTLLKSPVTWTEEIKGKEITFSGLNYIGAFELKINTLKIEFTLRMAEYLTSLPLIKYPRPLYRLDDRDYNAFAIGEAMCIHYSIDNNVIRQTEGKLSVKELLKYTSFPTYEVLKKHRWSWELNVKEPFENALDKLKQCGFLKNYQYCYSGGIEITDEEMRAGAIDSYEKFISLIVKFELNGYEDSETRAKEIKEKRAEKLKKLQARRKKQKKADKS